MGSLEDQSQNGIKPIQLPVINVSNLDKDTGAQLVDAAIKYGFLYINPSGTGFTSAIVDREFGFSREFFATSVAEKEQYHIDTTNRGWAGLNNEVLDPKHQRRGDFKEVFNLGEFSDTGSTDQHLPSIFRGREAEHFEFEQLCKSMCERILDLIGIGLEVEEDKFFSKRHTKPSGTTLRMLHYPSVPESVGWDDEVDVRAGAHSDYGSMTLLFQRLGQPGLEIRTPADDSWAPVAVMPNGYEGSQDLPPILVNIADLMNYWTNGLLKSTVHRVIFPAGSPKGEDRYSMAYFCHPCHETLLVPVPSRLVREKGDIPEGVEVGYGGGSSTKRALTAQEHFLNRINATYAYRKGAD